MKTNTFVEADYDYLIFDVNKEILVSPGHITDLTPIELHVLCEHHNMSENAQYKKVSPATSIKLITSQDCDNQALEKAADKYRRRARYVSQDWQPVEVGILFENFVLCRSDTL